MKLLSRLLVSALALLIVSYFVSAISVDGLVTALIAAIILGLLNAIVRPILIILTLPVTIVTLGLFIFVINASLFWFAASFIEGFSVTTFWWALIGSVLVSIISTIGNKLID